MRKRSALERGILFLLAYMMLITYAAPVHAADAEYDYEIEEDEVAYIGEYNNLARNAVIRTCSASIAISGNTATCAGTGSAYASMASSVKLTVYLQKYNSSWSSIASWSTTSSGTTAVLSKDATVTSGTYRTKVVCTAGGESITVYSTTKTK